MARALLTKFMPTDLNISVLEYTKFEGDKILFLFTHLSNPQNNLSTYELAWQVKTLATKLGH